MVCYKKLFQTQRTAKSNPSAWIKTKTTTTFFISHSISMLNLSLNELKLFAKLTDIKGCKSMSKERLLSALSESESVEIWKNLYDIKNPKNLSTLKIKEIEESLFKLEERLSNFKNYHPQDDFEHRNIKDIRNLFNRVALNEIAFNLSIHEDYYRPVRTKKAINGNYVKYASKGGKDKNLSPKEYLNMIRPYLRDIINDHKTPK